MSREIGWSHNVAIFRKCKNDLERVFKEKMIYTFKYILCKRSWL